MSSLGLPDDNEVNSKVCVENDLIANLNENVKNINENNVQDADKQQEVLTRNSSTVDPDIDETNKTKEQDTNQDLKGLNSYCKNLGLCLRCQLRYLGELYSSAAFVDSQSALKDRINEILNVTNDDQTESQLKKFKTSTFCFCCIGLLENGCEEGELNQIFDKVRDFEYKFKDFQINLFLPVSNTIREQIIYAKLLNKFRHLEDHLKQCYSLKEVYKFFLIRKISKLTGAKTNINSKTEIAIEFKYGNLQVDCLELYSKCKNMFNLKAKQKLEVTFSQTAVSKALQKLGIKGLIGLKLDRPDRCVNIESVSLSNHPLFVVGRYNKYSRDISQTPWVMNGVQKRDSVEQVIVKAIKKHISCEKTRFSASGREDVDVRMLNRGRPFVLELLNPSSLEIDKSVLVSIRKDAREFSNNEIDLKDLQFGEKEEVATNLRCGEMEKKKTYRALCISTRPINKCDIDKLNAIKDLTIQQNTPLRVLHRRSLAIRPKKIHDLKIELIENETHKFYLNLMTEAGTYVKEFVNSDFGRTSPSLETLLGDCETDILELDVLEIHFNWPPFIDDQNDLTTNSEILNERFRCAMMN